MAAALAARGLDADAVLGVLEGAAFHGHISHAADGLAADGHAVAVQERAIGHGDVFAGRTRGPASPCRT